VLGRIDRLRKRTFAWLAFAWIILAAVIVGGAVAYDNEQQVWDVQTFALLVGVGGYFGSQVVGKPRTASIELAFVWSASAAVFASVTAPGSSSELLPFLGFAIFLAAIAVIFRRIGPLYEEALDSPSEPQRAPAARVHQPLSATEHRVRTSGLRTLVVAVVAGVAGGLIWRFGRRH
jgi:hypothetical protein